MFKVTIEGIAELTEEVKQVELNIVNIVTNFIPSKPKVATTMVISGQISFDSGKLFMLNSTKALASWSLLNPGHEDIYKKITVVFNNTEETIYNLTDAYVISYHEQFEDHSGFFQLIVKEISAKCCSVASHTVNPIPSKTNNELKHIETSQNERPSINNGRGIQGRRASKYHELTESEILSLKEDIKAIGADPTRFYFNQGTQTSYVDEKDKINVRGDVLPDLDSNHPRDRMSSRATLAHEYYGHRANKGTKLAIGSWNDEFRASYMAARNAPGLSNQDRYYLVLDAIERAREALIPIKINAFMRRIINNGF